MHKKIEITGTSDHVFFDMSIWHDLSEKHSDNMVKNQAFKPKKGIVCITGH